MSAWPSRRDEGWRWTDLRAALADVARDAPDADHPLAALAGRIEAQALAPGERGVRVDALPSQGALAATALDLSLGAGAHLVRFLLQPQTDGIATALTRVRLAAGAVFRQFVLAEGGALVRIETIVAIEGAGAEVDLNGVYLAGPGRHVDLTTRVTHAVGGARTGQLVKGAARAGGRGVFQGRIEVARGAQQTDARQHHQALLLEPGAEAFAKPELIIEADDVQCAHGNTVGGLSDEQLFYLRARGIPAAEARALLTEAFLAEAVPEWLPAAERDTAIERIRAWLGGGAP